MLMEDSRSIHHKFLWIYVNLYLITSKDLLFPSLYCVYSRRRQAAKDLGLKKAADVPMSIIRIANQCWPHLVSLAEHGNIACKSDLQVTSHSPCIACDVTCRLVAKLCWLVYRELSSMFISTSKISRIKITVLKYVSFLAGKTCIYCFGNGPDFWLYSCKSNSWTNYSPQTIRNVKPPIYQWLSEHQTDSLIRVAEQSWVCVKMNGCLICQLYEHSSPYIGSDNQSSSVLMLTCSILLQKFLTI